MNIDQYTSVIECTPVQGNLYLPLHVYLYFSNKVVYEKKRYCLLRQCTQDKDPYTRQGPRPGSSVASNAACQSRGHEIETHPGLHSFRRLTDANTTCVIRLRPCGSCLEMSLSGVLVWGSVKTHWYVNWRPWYDWHNWRPWYDWQNWRPWYDWQNIENGVKPKSNTTRQ